MTLNLEEPLLRLADAARLIPGRRGRGVPIATIYRWIRKGCNGVVLESVQVGGTRNTTKSTLAEFADHLTSQRNRGRAPQNNCTTRQVERELDAAGVS